MQTYEHGTFLIVLDCDDLDRAANFWCDALGYDRPYPQSGPYVQLVALDRGGVELLLQQTADPKTSKNRLHLDLRTPDLDAEVHRLTRARRDHHHRRPADRTRLAMARAR